MGGEIQLTDGVQGIIKDGYKVRAVLLTGKDIRLDIGTPETYWQALKTTYERNRRGPKS